MSDGDPRVRRALDDLAEAAQNGTHAADLWDRTQRRITAHRRRRRCVLAGVVVLALLVPVLGIPALMGDDKPRRVAAGPADRGVDPSMPGRVAAVTTDGRLLVIDSASGETLSELAPTVSLLRYTDVSAASNGLTLFTGAHLAGAESIQRRHLGSGREDYVASGIWPSVSPDGRRLAFVGPNGSGTYGAGDTLHVVELETGEERIWPVDPYDPPTGSLPPPRWSPDSRHLVFNAHVRGLQIKDGPSLRVFDTEKDSSVADAPTVSFAESEDVSGYLGTTGDLLGGSDADPEGGSLSEKGQPRRVVAIDARTGEVTRDLFELRGAQQPVADATGRHVLAIDGDGALYRWSAGDDQPTELANGIAAATWIPDAATEDTTAATTPPAATAGGAWEMLPEAPISGRSNAAVVWTGAEMVVWGGEGKDNEPFGDGAAYDPTTRTWRTIAQAPLEARAAPTAVWTGTEMIVWGGAVESGRDIRPGVTVYAADGAAYDPVADSWRSIAEAPITTSWDTWAVWTSGEMFVGGREPSTSKFELAAYVPVGDTWRVVTPPESGDLKGIWTGSELLVWSDSPTEVGQPHGYAYVNGSDSWRRLADAPRSSDAANDIFGFEPVAWTGEVVIGKRAYGTQVYDPATDTYREVAGAWGGGNSARVWTGREILDWGGTELEADSYGADGDAYDLATDTVTALPPSPLQGRQSPAAVWTGDEMLVWGGLRERASGVSYRWFADGAAYRPPEVTPQPATIIAVAGDGIVERSSVDGSVVRTIVSGRANGATTHVEVDRAGNRVFFGESLECGSTIWQVPLDGGRPEKVSWGSGASVSPDGRWLAFPRVEDGCAAGVLVLHEIAGGGERFWRDAPAEYLGAEWAPDGQRLAVGVYTQEEGEPDGEIRILDNQNRYATFASSPVLTRGFLEDSVVVDGRWVLAVIRRCDQEADSECKDEVLTVDGDTGEQIELFGSWRAVDEVDLDATGRHALVLAREQTEAAYQPTVMFAVEPGGRGRRIGPAAGADW